MLKGLLENLKTYVLIKYKYVFIQILTKYIIHNFDQK